MIQESENEVWSFGDDASAAARCFQDLQLKCMMGNLIISPSLNLFLWLQLPACSSVTQTFCRSLPTLTTHVWSWLLQILLWVPLESWTSLTAVISCNFNHVFISAEMTSDCLTEVKITVWMMPPVMQQEVDLPAVLLKLGCRDAAAESEPEPWLWHLTARVLRRKHRNKHPPCSRNAGQKDDLLQEQVSGKWKWAAPPAETQQTLRVSAIRAVSRRIQLLCLISWILYAPWARWE